MKRIHTTLHNNGVKGFGHWPKIDRGIVQQIIKERNEPIRRQEVIGDFIILLGEYVRVPVAEGNYIVYDTTAETQTVVRLIQMDYVWYVLPVGSTVRTRLDQYNQRYFRWIIIAPLDREVLMDLRRRPS